MNSVQQAFDEKLRPTLKSLGFTEVMLSECMHPDFLFQRGTDWFSFSWDWRDCYLEVGLGRLHWFRDVMPRFVVIGDFSYWNSEVSCDAIRTSEDAVMVIDKIRYTLPRAASEISNHHHAILESFKKSRDSRIDAFLGSEVGVKDLAPYTAKQ